MGFSYSVMGVGVQYKLISGMLISPDHSIGETTMFPEAFGQTLDYHPNLDGILGDGIYGCRWITNLISENNATPHSFSTTSSKKPFCALDRARNPGHVNCNAHTSDIMYRREHSTCAHGLGRDASYNSFRTIKE